VEGKILLVVFLSGTVLGILWLACGINFAYLTRLNAGLRNMPYWLLLPLYPVSIALGPFAERVLDPILDRHFPYPEDEIETSDDA